jgi:transposase
LFNLKEEDLEYHQLIHHQNKVIVTIQLKRKHIVCPICGGHSIGIKDYRKRTIVHSVLNGVECKLVYRRRRYSCKTCQKSFNEKNPFVRKQKRMSILTETQVLKDLKIPNETFTTIANRYYMSTTNVIDLFDRHLNISRGEFSSVVCIDEFYLGRHGVAGKYACILLDFIKNEIIDILPSRRKYYLLHYFQSIPQKELERVRFVSIDMWDTYRDIARLVFKKAIVCVDSFHVIWNINQALMKLRIRVMNRYEKESIEYYLLKKFNFLLMKSGDDILYNEPRFNHRLNRYINYQGLLKLVLDIDEDLSAAYQLKEIYLRFNRKANLDTAESQFHSILDAFKIANIPEYLEIVKMLKKWKQEIINSFHWFDGRRVSNGILESKNARIKVILKNANGYRNFDRLRTRIMYSLNKNSAPSLNQSFPSKRYELREYRKHKKQ